MNIQNPLVKHGLTEIINAVKREALDEKYNQLLAEIKKQKNGALKTDLIKEIIGKVFSKQTFVDQIEKSLSISSFQTEVAGEIISEASQHGKTLESLVKYLFNVGIMQSLETILSLERKKF